MGQRLNKQRPRDRLKDNFKREHQKEANKAILGCLGETVKDDSLTLTDSVPPFKNYRPFICQKIHQIFNNCTLLQQKLQDRVQSALWLYKVGHLNIFQVLYFTQLIELKSVPIDHDIYLSPRNPVEKGWISQGVLDFIQKENYIPLDFVNKFASKNFRKNIRKLLHRINIDISDATLKALYERYVETYKKPKEAEQVLTSQKLQSKKVNNDIQSAITSLRKSVSSSKIKKSQKHKKPHPINIRVWQNENVNDDTYIKNKNYSLSSQNNNSTNAHKKALSQTSTAIKIEDNKRINDTELQKLKENHYPTKGIHRDYILIQPYYSAQKKWELYLKDSKGWGLWKVAEKLDTLIRSYYKTLNKHIPLNSMRTRKDKLHKKRIMTNLHYLETHC